MLLTAHDVGKSYGPRLLFTGITLGLAEGERIGLIGANGAGKSTLLRIFAGLEQPDEGRLESKRQLRTAYVAQTEEFDPQATCLDIVADAIDSHVDEHDRHLQAEQALTRAGFADAHATAQTLSGGWLKRLAIVRQLATDPQLLLMDEPTNHLDLVGIAWLEKLINTAPFATLIVSHDRRFLESVANRIIELGRAYPDGFLSHQGKYSDFVAKREEFLEAQQARQQSLAGGVRREIEWLRRGAKARTTKAKGRIERAENMMAELADLKQRNSTQTGAAVDFTASDRKTRKLMQLKNVSKRFGDHILFEDLNLILAPGQGLGLLGPNGSGKSTLIHLLSGQLQPDHGEIIRADQLRVVVFDQHREQLDQEQTLRHALSPSGDMVAFQGQQQHITGWAKRFSFRTEQLDLPVSQLSGGEQARVLIARLMLRQADVLILDEPTNDLDILTLEVLESSLLDFAGALVLVTHDRYLLDRVSTELLALDGNGHANFYADLDQWEQSQRTGGRESAPVKPASTPTITPERPTTSVKKRLSWKDQKELEGMEPAIAAAEAKLAELQEQVADPAIMADHVKMRDACKKLSATQAEVDRLYARWAELETP